jgi:hypothetical protein
MRRRILLSLALLLVAGNAQAAGIAISVNGFSFEPTDTVVVSFFATGFGQGVAPAIRSYDITLEYGPALFEVTTASFGDPLLGNQLNPSGFGTVRSTSFGPGSATLFESASASTSAAALIGAQADTFVLAQVFLRPIGTGFGLVSLEVNELRDTNGAAFSGLTNQLATSIQVVPEPSSAALLCGGLLWLARARWRRGSQPRA